MKLQSMRTPIARARGLGSAKDGAGHWWMQRVTAIALIPLTIWFLVSFLMLIKGDHAAYLTWLASPFNMALMAAFLGMLFYHMALGLRVVVEDYIHGPLAKILVLAIIQIGCFLLFIAGITALLVAIV